MQQDYGFELDEQEFESDNCGEKPHFMYVGLRISWNMVNISAITAVRVRELASFVPPNFAFLLKLLKGFILIHNKQIYYIINQPCNIRYIITVGF